MKKKPLITTKLPVTIANMQKPAVRGNMCVCVAVIFYFRLPILRVKQNTYSGFNTRFTYRFRFITKFNSCTGVPKHCFRRQELGAVLKIILDTLQTTKKEQKKSDGSLANWKQEQNKKNRRQYNLKISIEGVGEDGHSYSNQLMLALDVIEIKAEFKKSKSC